MAKAAAVGKKKSAPEECDGLEWYDGYRLPDRRLVPFIDQIIAAPDDELVRRVYADFLGDNEIASERFGKFLRGGGNFFIAKGVRHVGLFFRPTGGIGFEAVVLWLAGLQRHRIPRAMGYRFQPFRDVAPRWFVGSRCLRPTRHGSWQRHYDLKPEDRPWPRNS